MSAEALRDVPYSDAERTYRFSDLLPVVGLPARRYILECLHETPSLRLDALTDELGCWSAVDSPADVQIVLRHVHLPLLADHGFIRWDEDADRIHRGPTFDAIEPLLELLKTFDDELPVDQLPEV